MDIILPSSPVWYQTTSSDTSKDGYFAFASRSLIYLLDIKRDIPSYYGVLSGHEERVTACSFCAKKTNSQNLLLASADDSGVIKIWNIFTKTIIKENKVPGSGKVSSLHWSPLSEYLIVYGDDKGCLVVWNYEKGITNKYYPDGPHQQLSCVVCSPHHNHLVAVGYKSGAVSVVDIMNRGMVVRKFRGHGNEIHSIVWSQSPSEDILNTMKVESKCDNDLKPMSSHPIQFEGVLVSGSKDRTIRVWSLMKGKAVKILKLKSKTLKSKRNTDDSSRIYVALHWPDNSDTSFLSSSFYGDLLLWDLSKPDKEMCQTFSSQSPECGHQRIIFNINSGFDSKSTVITTSMDRQIKLWSLSSPQSPPTCSLPTLGGFVYSIAVSPLDPSMLAIGVGDGAIRVWKTQNPRNPFDITVLWQGVKEKVMSLAWHPQKDGVLAFGTEDGKIGLYDVLSMKAPTLSETYHLKPVYAISWGCKSIIRGDEMSDAMWLYTCGGEGVILMHPPDLKGDGVDIRVFINASNLDHVPPRRSEVAWRSDSKLVAMGNDNGTYDVYAAPHLHHLLSVKVHNKIINCLRWSPCNSSFFIASGSNNNHVCITNIEEYVHDLSRDHDKKITTLTEPYRTLIGHTGRITGLSWSRDNITQLASTSYDGTVQVWDVSKGEGLANYRGHDGRALCVEWTPIMNEAAKSGYIYSGGDDYSVHVWRAEQQENSTPPTEPQHIGFTQKQSTLWKKKNKRKKHQVSNHTDQVASPVESDVIDELLEKKKQELLDNIQANSNGAENFPELDPTPMLSVQNSSSSLDPDAESFAAPPSVEIKQMFQDLSDNRTPPVEGKEEGGCRGSRRKRVKNILPLSVLLDNQKKEIQQEDCIDIIRYKNNQSLQSFHERPNLGLYCDRKSTYRMLREEDEKLVENENYDGSYLLRAWSGDIISAVESAIERNDLTDQLVAMAPMAGYDVWLRACSSFATQLAGEGLYLHAANYLVVCNKVRDAIVLLRDNKFYREAVVMARARLHDNDPLLIETIKIWAHRLKNGGTYELAAKCFASIGENRTAAECLCEKARSKTLLKTEDLRSLFVAAVFAKEAGLDDCHNYMKLALSDIATRSGNWNDGHMAARGFHWSFGFVRLILCVHELLYIYLSSSSNDHSTSLDKFSDCSHSKYIPSTDLSDFDFKKVLSEVWKELSNEMNVEDKQDSSACVNVKDIEVLCSSSSYSSLTNKQTLLKASLHLSSIFVESNLARGITSQSSHVTSFLAVTDEWLLNKFRGIISSFHVLNKKENNSVLCNNLSVAEQCQHSTNQKQLNFNLELTAS